MKKRYYIAYGSNLNIRQMRMRCPSARIIGISEIPDYELLFKGSRTGSYLTIEPKKGSRVPVAAWEVNAEDEQALDRYEGFPTFYYKAEMKLPIKGIRSGRRLSRKTDGCTAGGSCGCCGRQTGGERKERGGSERDNTGARLTVKNA